ncbi:SPOR domain-containing protein [Ralstonia pickettii]|uniref:SPOR domain-containing protein n=1 Tax=Ralstonia pickettii TaxID=329 RepID=UPI0015BA859F|nr:SPOR domain-containing protein [Ralstonia pickettii]NWK43066.1 SPOR domain-containing protein [Ralstonia pickettii]
MTLRLALLLLLLVNGVLLAANTGVFGPEVSKAWFESDREPERMRRQIRTEEIRILEPAPVSSPAAAVPKSAPGSPEASSPAASGTQANIEPTALTTAAAAENGGTCTELGGLTEAQATRSIDQLRQVAGVQVERFTRQEDNRWWVHMPARDTRDDAERKVSELKRRSVADSTIVQEGNTFVVSLGLFRDKERAQQRLDELRAKDVRTAVVTQTRRLGSLTSLRVTATADAASGVAAQLAALKKTLGTEDLHACAAVTASR